MHIPSASFRWLEPLNEARWRAVVARDYAFDRSFLYSVETTGIYCRPSCPSRRPNRANVRFHDTAEEAERMGFRPCKRCRPNGPSLALQHIEKVRKACRLIEIAKEAPKLYDLADAVGLSPYHFHRIFKSVVGVTPRAYACSHRNAEIKFGFGECSHGYVLVATSEKGVCAILLGDDPESLLKELQDQFPRVGLIAANKDFEQLVAKVVGFVETPQCGFDLPLDMRGTPFQRRVWEALRHVSSGATASYAEIAQAIGAPKAVRPVASACAANHLAVVIPCHRVIRADGSLSGYRWGVERKRALLAKEANR